MTLNYNQLIKIFNPKKFFIQLNTNCYEIQSRKFPNKHVYICTEEFYITYSKFWILSERKNCTVGKSLSTTKIIIKEIYIKNFLRNHSLNYLLND
jgi:hypothetical protein